MGVDQLANASVMLTIRSDLSFDPKKCIGCEACATACPRGAIQITEYPGFETITCTFAPSGCVMHTTRNSRIERGSTSRFGFSQVSLLNFSK